MSRNTFSPETAITVPSSPLPCSSDLWECDCSYCERMSPKFSADSLGVWEPERAAGSWSTKLGLAMRRYLYCGIIPTGMPERASGRWTRFVRPTDLVWLAVFTALVANALGYPYVDPVFGAA